MTQILCNKYDARALAFRIAYQSDIRSEEAYKEAKDELLDETMSCDVQEAIDWMIHEMESAIRYGKLTQNRDWRYKFLAAYDICDKL